MAESEARRRSVVCSEPNALCRVLVGSSWEHLDLISPGGRFDTVADRFEGFKPFAKRPKPAVKPGA